MLNKAAFKSLITVVLLAASFLCFADSGAAEGTVGAIADTLKTNFVALAKLVTAGAYLAGMGFAVGAILKFKQHKDNPTQIPVGTPVAMLFVAAALLFLPSIMSVAGQSIFGADGSVGGTEGKSSFGDFE